MLLVESSFSTSPFSPGRASRVQPQRDVMAMQIYHAKINFSRKAVNRAAVTNALKRFKAMGVVIKYFTAWSDGGPLYMHVYYV